MDSLDLDWLVTMALEVGPDGRFVLPGVGAVVGLLAFGGVFLLVSQRIAWRLGDLVRAIRGSFHAAEVGQAVTVLGRLRAPGSASIASFERSDRRAVVSSLHERRAGALACVATRSAPRLELVTREGAIPLEGLLDVRRTRASRRARNVDDRAAARASAPTALRAADLRDGQWVLASGIVRRVLREGLREQAGVSGLSGASTPIVLTALRPELPRWTIPIALVGALVFGALLTPIPWGQGRALIQIEHRAAWCVMTAAQLLGPTRSWVVASIGHSPNDGSQREWALLAARERGDCAEEAALLAAFRRDEEALAVIEGCRSALDPRLTRTLLREAGHPQRAIAVVDANLTASESGAMQLEAGHVTHYYAESWLDAGSARPPDGELACGARCLLAIRDLGETALESVDAMLPLRRGGLDCGSPEIGAILGELGLVCGRFSAADGVRALRLSPRSLDGLRPLSEIEARLHVARVLFEAGGETVAATQVRERQRRILAVLSTEGGRRAEVFLRYQPSARPPEVGCSPPMFDENGVPEGMVELGDALLAPPRPFLME